MRFKSELKGNFPTGKQISAAGGRAAMRAARIFRTATVNRMTESTPRGNIDSYEGLPNRRGRGFTRRFRRSAPGQRPAIETSTLINAVTAKKVSDTAAEVFIADRKNPRNGASAEVYAEILQKKLGRKIMTDQDIQEAANSFNSELKKEFSKL